jgi:hypothetical protein
MSFERFEQVVALVLSAVIAVIIMVSLFSSSPSSSRCWFSMPSIPWTRYSERVRHDRALDRDGVQAFVRVALRRDSIIQLNGGLIGDRTLPQVRDPRPDASPQR